MHSNLTGNRPDDSFLDKGSAGHYWTGSLTRAEAQKVFDEQAQTIMQLIQTVGQLNILTAYLSEQAGVKPEAVAEWIKAKTAEKAAAVQVTEGTDPVVANPVLVN